MEDIENQSISVNISLPDLKNLTSWATFVGVMEIIIGGFSCLGIITAAYGVPQLISGLKLLNAVEDLRKHMITNDMQKISDAFVNLNKFFKLNGITTIVKISFFILGMILYGIIIAYVITNMPGIMNPKNPLR